MTEAQLWPVIWILASMTVFVLVTLLVPAERLPALRADVKGRVLEQALRLIYFLGLPYAALLAGHLATIDLGLTGSGGPLLGWTPAEWLSSLGTALTLAVITFIPVAWASRQLARRQRLLAADSRSAGALVVDAVYAEAHWAFYRSAPLILLSDVYTAALFGAFLVLVEWAVVVIRNGLGQTEARQTWLRRALWLALSTTLFILTSNFWVILGSHLVLELALKVWLDRLVPRPIVPAASISPASDVERSVPDHPASQ
jgi:hypothetical protein